jgi:hypothetical protein
MKVEEWATFDACYRAYPIQDNIFEEISHGIIESMSTCPASHVFFGAWAFVIQITKMARECWKRVFQVESVRSNSILLCKFCPLPILSINLSSIN